MQDIKNIKNVNGGGIILYSTKHKTADNCSTCLGSAPEVS